MSAKSLPMLCPLSCNHTVFVLPYQKKHIIYYNFSPSFLLKIMQLFHSWSPSFNENVLYIEYARLGPVSGSICPAGVSLSKQLFCNCSFALLTIQAKGEFAHHVQLSVILLFGSHSSCLKRQTYTLLLSQGLATINQPDNSLWSN